MIDSSLLTLSNSLGEIVESAAPRVVQVQGRRPSISGVVHSPHTVLTNARGLGSGDGVRVRRADGAFLDAELRGWDPATGLALLHVDGLDAEPLEIAGEPARVGNLAVAVARSWSNAVTASIGMVSVIGGPLPTGRGLSVDQVIRTTAPMHEGFAGGAFLDMSGRLLGIATAATIRGLGVIIPIAIAWKCAEELERHGTVRRGYLGVASQPVRLSARQSEIESREHGLLVVAVKEQSPAASAGLLVGDVILAFGGRTVEAPEDLMDLLSSDRVGTPAPIRVLRGDRIQELSVTLGNRSTT